MNYKELTAPCGLDCFNCPAYLAQNDENIRKEMASILNISEEQAQCLGCRPNNGVCAWQGRKEPCQVYKCTKEKGYHTCADCTDDFPCDYLHPVADKATDLPHNTKLFNICLIKKMGIEAWAKEKAKSVKDVYFSKKFSLD